MHADENFHLDASDKVLTWAARLVRLLLVISAIIALAAVNWLEFFVSVGVLMLTFITSAIHRWYKIRVPLEIEVFMVIFIYAATFLGEVRDYYGRFWWWDSMLHFSSALVFGFVGFLILYILYYQKKMQASAFLIAVFAFSFSMAIGAIWEVFEFGMDQAFNLNMQPSGEDTMKDLIINGIGALITSSVGYQYIRKSETGILRRLISKFFRDNPRFAGRIERSHSDNLHR